MRVYRMTTSIVYFLYNYFDILLKKYFPKMLQEDFINGKHLTKFILLCFGDE